LPKRLWQFGSCMAVGRDTVAVMSVELIRAAGLTRVSRVSWNFGDDPV
jgi:hypothetical protein